MAATSRRARRSVFAKAGSGGADTAGLKRLARGTERVAGVPLFMNMTGEHGARSRASREPRAAGDDREAP